MAQLVSARPSVREVPSLISGDDNTSLFQLLSYVCSFKRSIDGEMEGKISAQSTSCLSVELLSRYQRKIWLLFFTSYFFVSECKQIIL